jgi:hypothetical protein
VVLEPVGAGAAAAPAPGDARDVGADADNDQEASVDVATALGTAFDVVVLGALPVGRIRIFGNEPTHNVSGYATREPTRRLSGVEPRSEV